MKNFFALLNFYVVNKLVFTLAVRYTTTVNIYAKLVVRRPYMRSRALWSGRKYAVLWYCSLTRASNAETKLLVYGCNGTDTSFHKTYF